MQEKDRIVVGKDITTDSAQYMLAQNNIKFIANTSPIRR